MISEHLFAVIDPDQDEVVYRAASLEQAVGFIDAVEGEYPTRIAVEISAWSTFEFRYSLAVVDSETGALVGVVKTDVDLCEVARVLSSMQLVVLPSAVADAMKGELR